MYIPRIWSRASGNSKAPDGRDLRFDVWGWGDDEATASGRAAERLQRLLERVRRGEPIPTRYGYGDRPLREEILQTVQGEYTDSPSALLTRNSYGAKVLNTSRLLFLDIDVAEPGMGQRLRRMFKRSSSEDERLDALRASLRQQRGAFRIYKTAAGYRVMAIDRDFDPVGSEARDLMQSTGTDAAFLNLCVAQRSFRARLTPKPWRCGCQVPPGQHPRRDDETRQRFAEWLGKYETAAQGYATCQFLETVGTGLPGGDARRLQELHDQATRCNESLPLA